MLSSRMFILVAGLCVGLTAGLGDWSRAADAPEARPSWIDHPKSDDSVFLYRVGYSAGQKDAAAARQEAYRNALSAIVGEMLSRSGVDKSLQPDLAASLPVQNAEIVPGAVHTETNQAGFACWVQVSYPLAEKAKLLERIEPEKLKVLERVEFDRRMAGLLAEARAAHSRGEYESARTNLQVVVESHARLRAPTFDWEDAQVLLGDTCGAQKDFLEARRNYEGVAQNSSSAAWKAAATAKLKALPRAPRAWPLNDRWRGRRVALLCAQREVGQAPRPFTALVEILGRDCRESRLESVEVTGDLKADELVALFGQGSVAAACEAAKRKGAGVVVAVLLSTDPAKRGQTEDMMGVAMPVADSEVTFLVVDAEGGTAGYGDRFSEVAGTRSESRFAERVASILVEKYLVPKCPALAPHP